MNRKRIFIIAFLLFLLLSGCTSRVLLPTKSQSKPIPTHATASEVPSQTPVLDEGADMLPEGISVPFMRWIYDTYGADVYHQLMSDFQSDTDGGPLWHDLTGSSLFVLKDQFSGILSSPDQARFENIWLKETQSPDEVLLSFAGDVSFADGYANMASYQLKGGIDQCILKEVRERMAAADIMMVNNEFCYSKRGTPLAGKAFTFRADPSMVQNLNTLSVDVVSVANNHVYDYGPEALLDTLDTLSDAGIAYAGAGRDIKEAANPVYFIAGGMKISYVCATEIERSTRFTKGADLQNPGVLRTDSSDYLAAVDTAKANSDFVVVFMHWGTEGTNYFANDQQTIARQLIDHGAGLVIGCHPHVLQGIEYYRDVPIVYSLGNFWFNSKTIPTGLIEAVITPKGLQNLKFIPCLQKNCETSLLPISDQKRDAIHFLNQLSPGVSIDEQGTIIQSP